MNRISDQQHHVISAGEQFVNDPPHNLLPQDFQTFLWLVFPLKTKPRKFKIVVPGKLKN